MALIRVACQVYTTTKDLQRGTPAVVTLSLNPLFLVTAGECRCYVEVLCRIEPKHKTRVHEYPCKYARKCCANICTPVNSSVRARKLRP